MNEYFLIGVKTLFFLIIILILIRLMGKRELGQLNVFDIMVSFMISEIFSNAIADAKSNVFLTLIPIFIIFIIQIIISYISLKSKRIRELIEAKPTIIILNGIIDYEVMKKQRYNFSDLLMQVRENGVSDIKNIAYAVLENNGNLTIMEKKTSIYKYPFPIIVDGKYQDDVIDKLKINKNELIKSINSKYKINDLLLVFIDINDKFVVFSKKSNCSY